MKSVKLREKVKKYEEGVKADASEFNVNLSKRISNYKIILTASSCFNDYELVRKHLKSVQEMCDENHNGLSVFIRYRKADNRMKSNLIDMGIRFIQFNDNDKFFKYNPDKVLIFGNVLPEEGLDYLSYKTCMKNIPLFLNLDEIVIDQDNNNVIELTEIPEKKFSFKDHLRVEYDPVFRKNLLESLKNIKTIFYQSENTPKCSDNELYPKKKPFHFTKKRSKVSLVELTQKLSIEDCNSENENFSDNDDEDDDLAKHLINKLTI